MKVAIYSRGLDAEQENPLLHLLQELSTHKIKVVLYHQLLEIYHLPDELKNSIETFKTSQDLTKEIDCIISLGGDGTMLDAVTLVKNTGIPLLGINFGRYVDDFRFFTNTKAESLKALIVLQEFLLKRGLNLNTSKTKLIEAQEKIIEFIQDSNKSGVYGMPCEEESYHEKKPEKKLDKTEIIKEIDSGKPVIKMKNFLIQNLTNSL